MRRLVIPTLLTLTLLLAACAPSQASANQTNPETVSITTESPTSTGNDAAAPVDLSRTDQQGAVVVTVTPLDLGNSADQLEFDISLETHSVDLSMDLATLATLTTDTGLTVSANQWDAPRGGHHVAGKLIFPAVQDGKAVLEGDKTYTYHPQCGCTVSRF
jgi:ABC-type transport system substrate-binding protein